MITGLEFKKKSIELGKLIEARVFDPGKRKNAPAKPRRFVFVERKGKLLCVWCGNLQKKERVLFEISSPHRGYTLDEWDELTRLYCYTIANESDKDDSGKAQF